jgi:formyltetrahydrofolate hydrolase
VLGGYLDNHYMDRKLDKVSIPSQGVNRIWDWQNGEMMFYEGNDVDVCMLKECTKCTM